MKFCVSLAALFLPLQVLHAATATSVILSSSPNPATFGQAVTITAQISSSAATGKVTFFDGVTLLGVATSSGGLATFATTMLSSGVRSLTAYYSGDSEYSPGRSAPLEQTVNTVGAKTFQVSALYPVGQGPRCLAAADFNSDGKADLAVVNENSNTLSVLLGDGKGGFTAAGTYNVGFDPWFVATGDFNGDGKVDLVVVSTLDNLKTAQPGELNVLLGNGDGTFQMPLEFATGSLTQLSGLLPVQVSVADFNSDGKADFAVAANGSGDFDLLFGNGDGTFGNLRTYDLFRPVAITVGDFNGDGIADLALANSYDGNVYIYLGKGDGTFQPPVATYSVGSYAGFLAAADLNGDGKTDLVMAGGGTAGGLVYAWLGNGDGTFQTPHTLPVGKGPSSIAITDFNGDGIPDLVVTNSFDYTLSFLQGKGDGTFQTATTLSNSNFFVPESVVAADFNGDGIPDFAVANSGFGQVFIVLGEGAPAPDLTISKTHSGTVSQGQAGITYTISVSNIGLAPTSAAVSVVDSLPTGLTATAISGTGWSCTLSSLTCSRSDALAANAVYPSITVTVNVAATAPVSLTNTATVSGGGETNNGNDSAGDVTTVRQSAAVSVNGTLTASLAAGSTSSQQIPLTSPVAGIPWTANTTVSWLTLSPASGVTPATITVTIDATHLSPGPYSANITISNPLATPNQEVVAVSVVVTSGNATISAAPTVLTLRIQQGAQDQLQSIQISGTTGVAWQATATTSGGGSWLSASGSGTAPSSILVLVNSSSSLPGTYHGTITIQAPAATPSTTTIVLSLTVTPPNATNNIENLVFKGAANCTDSFCSRSGSGPISGDYSLDVTTGIVLAGWSFTTPFGVISSSDFGASTSIYTGGVSESQSTVFSVSTSSVNESLSLAFSGTNSRQLGALLTSGACINIPGGEMGEPACDPDYEITGSTTLAGVAGPAIGSGGIVPLDSSVTTIQPGEWISIFGANLAGSTVTWNGNFPTSLGGTSVTIDGRAAYLSFVSPTQINAQAPNDTVTGQVPIVVTAAAGTAAANVTLAQFAPSFVLLDTEHVAGLILRSNGTGAYGGGTYEILGPTGNSLGYSTVAAKAGDTVELFAVGLGPTSPAIPAGQALSDAAPTTNPVKLVINSVSVTPSFAGLSSAGLYQINLTIPAGLGTGDVSLVATVGGAQTSAVISLQ